MPDAYTNDYQQLYFDCAIFTGRFWYTRCSFLLQEKSIYLESQCELAAFFADESHSQAYLLADSSYLKLLVHGQKIKRFFKTWQGIGCG